MCVDSNNNLIITSITQKILKGEFKSGYQTPASCYGKDLILAITKIKRLI